MNGVPVFGRRGIDLTAKATRDHEEALTLELTRGTNRIEIYATNELGVESLYDTIEIEYTAAQSVKPDLYIAVIGVSTYKTDEYNLHYAAKDARDLADALEIGNREAFVGGAEQHDAVRALHARVSFEQMAVRRHARLVAADPQSGGR